MKTKLLFILAMLCSRIMPAQSSHDDLQLLRNYTAPATQENYNGRTDTVNNHKAIAYKHRNILLRYNPVSLAFTGAMFFYQGVISPQISAECLYQRTCSNFSKAAIHEFGLLRGVLLTADRLSRCSTRVLREIPNRRLDDHHHVIDEPSQFRRQ